MARVSNPFRYFFREAYPSETCVFKIWFGQRYFIWKCKALHQAVNNISVEIDRRLRLGLKDGDIYEKIVKYIRKARVAQFEVEVVFKSDNPVDVLKYEHKALKSAQKDELCLNTIFIPGLPKWVPETAGAEYNKWKQDLTKVKKEKKKNAAAKNTKTIPARGNGRAKGGVPNRGRKVAGV